MFQFRTSNTQQATGNKNNADSMMKRLILYDLDGTLVDTLADIADATNHMLRTLNAPPMPADTIRRFVGRGVHELVKACLRIDDVQRIEEGVAIYRAYYAQHLLDHSRLYPGATAVLDHFASRTQAVITNKPNPFSKQILETLGVARYFVDIVAGNSGYPRKPDPSSVRALISAAHVTPQETIFIGDSTIDIDTGRNAGITTVAVLHGLSDEPELTLAKPDLLVRDFVELLNYVTRQHW